jgi:hypothetical protein
MSRETLIGLILGVPVEIISGLYSGLIVARYQRFADLRSQVLRIIREIDFVVETSHVKLLRRKDVPELSLIASDFVVLRHSKATKKTLCLQKEISETLYLASMGKVSYESLEKHYASWQDHARKLRPNPIFSYDFGREYDSDYLWFTRG